MLEALVKRSSPLPVESKLLIFGGGFTGQHIAGLARALGTKVICTRRTNKKAGSDCAFDSESKLLPPKDFFKDVTHILSCVPPNQTGEDPVLNSLGKELRNIPLKWVGYLSTTGVYGDRQGEWVHETDEPKPHQPRSQRRWACEQAWLNEDLPIQILRLPGIYGPGRSAIKNILSGKTKMIHKPGQVFSRIHVDDIAGAAIHLMHLAEKDIKPKIINLADNLPCTNIEVMQYAASLLRTSLPPIEPFKIASRNMSPMAISFWEENRRVSNKMLCHDLGYSLVHPDYKSGLRDCLSQEKKVN